MTSPALNNKYDSLWEGLPSGLRLRLRRAISWVERAEREQADFDAAFVFYWIAFNAVYAEDHPEGYEKSEAEARNRFLQRVVELDSSHRITPIIWDRLARPIRELIHNQYVFQPFWKHQNLVPGNEDWSGWFERSKEIAANALERRDTVSVLRILFDRLYVLRNQIIHGGATWKGSVNRKQVQDGALIMAFLVPSFVNLVMDNAEVAWGPPHYPVVTRQEDSG